MISIIPGSAATIAAGHAPETAPSAQGLRVALAMDLGVAAKVFSLESIERLLSADSGLHLLDPEPLTTFDSERARAVLANTDVLITGWGCLPVDATVLEAAPNLKMVSHAAGSVKTIVEPVVWARSVLVSSAAYANSQPVAEYALAAILMSGKRVFELSRMLSEKQSSIMPDDVYPSMGNNRKQVGIVGASMIGRRVIALLRPFDFDVVVYDPYLISEEAEQLGVESVTLDHLLSTSDVISLHAPLLPQTRHMIGREQIGLIRSGATVINTARGGLVDHEALADRVLKGELHAVLDHTDPEVLPVGHPFYNVNNVVLTPHLAGSLGHELTRLADSAVAEVQRFMHGEPLQFAVHAEDMTTIA